MSNRILHALWDADEGRVALFLNPDRRFARWRARYNVFLTVTGEHGGRRDFLGIFDASRPTARDWPDLPPWILLPVLKGAIASFALELIPKAQAAGSPSDPAGELARPLRVEFDRSLQFDYRRRGVIEEERYYCWYAESAGARGAADRRRHVIVRGQEIEGDQLHQDDFVNGFVEAAAAPPFQHRVSRMLAFAVRDNRIGPAKEILGAKARREVRVAVELEPHLLPTLEQLTTLAADNGQETDSIDTKAFRSIVIDAEAYDQPRLSLRLGSSEQGARRLQERITFLHIPTNAMSALRTLQRPAAPGSPAEARANWVKRLLPVSDSAGARDPLDLLFDPQLRHVTYGADLPLLAERRGDSAIYYLDQAFDRVAMGDIVGIFVHDRVRLDYPSHRMESGEDAESKTAFSSLYLRFLINRLEPMDTERVIREYDEEIVHVLARVKRQLIERDGADEGTGETPPDVADGMASGGSGPQRGLRLADLLAPAIDQQLADEDRRRPRGKAGRLREVMAPAEFQRLPHVAHALCVTEQFGDKVKELGRKAPEADVGFCAAAVHMVGGTDRTRTWLKAHPAATQQATIWEMFEIDPYFIDRCADMKVAIPEAYRADPDMLRELAQLFTNSQRLERAARILVDFDRHEDARRLLGAAEGLHVPVAGEPTSGASIEDLDVIVGLLRLGEDLLVEDIDRLAAILAACKLPAETIDVASVAVGTGGDARALALLRTRAAQVLARKASPHERAAMLGELNRLRSQGVLEMLVERLEQVDHKSEILRVVIGTAEALTEWANATPLQHSEAPDTNGRAAQLGEAEWDAICRSLRAPDLLADGLHIARLATEPQPATQALGPELSLCAAQLQALVAAARHDAQARLGAAATRAGHELNAQFASLEQFAGVALATLTARHLTAAAVQIREQVATLPPGTGADMDALGEAWNGLGRALAPDRALLLLPDALRHAEVLFQRASQLMAPSGVAVPLMTLPPTPTYGEVRPMLAG